MTKDEKAEIYVIKSNIYGAPVEITSTKKTAFAIANMVYAKSIEQNRIDGEQKVQSPDPFLESGIKESDVRCEVSHYSTTRGDLLKSTNRVFADIEEEATEAGETFKGTDCAGLNAAKFVDAIISGDNKMSLDDKLVASRICECDYILLDDCGKESWYTYAYAKRYGFPSFQKADGSLREADLIVKAPSYDDESETYVAPISIKQSKAQKSSEEYNAK